MTTKDNKLSCQSSSSGENSIPNQLLLLQQLNNTNNNIYSTSPREKQASSQKSNNQINTGNNSALQNASVLQKLANVNAASSSASSQHGRWTKEEHQKFLEGLNKYGKNWKKVEEHIGTRTGAQIRSHAQKFFNRLEKEFGKTNILKDLNGNSASCQLNQQQQNQSQQGVSHQLQAFSQSSQNQGIDLASSIPAEYAHQLLKLDRQQDFYDDITPMISHLNSSPESGEIHQNVLHMISQNNSVSLNIKPTEGQEGIPKKKDWSKILSAQEKLKQTASSENSVSGGSNQFILNKKEKKQIIKNEKKMTKQLTQLLDQQCQHLTQNIPYENQGNKEIDFDSLNQMGIDQEVSPSDFISQNLLNSIFEPADIETHLIQFYIAQMNLEQLISQRKNYELNEVSPYMQSQMQKKKKLSVDSTSSANNNLMSNIANNLDNISCSQLSHSTAISNTSPSSSAFSAPRYNQNKIALPQPNNFAAVQQNRTQQLQQKQMRNQSLKENTQEIGQIAEYQQSLLLFNLLSSLSNNSGQQQQSQDLPINNRQSTPSMKDISSPKFNNNLANNNNNAQQDLSNDLETELLKHLLLNLEQKQTNEFQSQYPSQDILSQKQNNSTSNNFKMPSVPNCFNSKNEQQSLNFTSTEEDEDDENYNFSLLQKQLMQVLTQQPQKQNQNQAILQSLKNARC